MCRKIDYRIECLKCGYPLGEAQFPDSEPPLPCHFAEDEVYNDYIRRFLLENFY